MNENGKLTALSMRFEESKAKMCERVREKNHLTTNAQKHDKFFLENSMNKRCS